MSATNDGGPAFPVVRMPIDPETILNHPGMTLRDWFAGQALGAVIQKFEVEGYEIPDGAACVAYEYADAMIEARKMGGAK